MVDFKTPSLPGANEIYNHIAKKAEEIDTTAIEKMASDASDVVSKLKTDLTDLKAKTGDLIPELPSVPSVNLQSELTALTGLPAGSSQYTDKLASITSKFGSGLSAGGYNIDSVVSDASSAISGATSALAAGTSSVSPASALSAKVPNFELPPGATEAVEKAKASLLASAQPLKELAHSFSENVTQDDAKGLFGDKVARDTQSSNLGSVLANLESMGKAFDKKANAIEEQIKKSNQEKREEEPTTIGV